MPENEIVPLLGSYISIPASLPSKLIQTSSPVAILTLAREDDHSEK